MQRFRLDADEIDRRLRMPLSFVSDGGVGPEVVCERVMEMVRRRLNAGESSTKSESVAFKVGCKINQHDSHGLIELQCNVCSYHGGPVIAYDHFHSR